MHNLIVNTVKGLGPVAQPSKSKNKSPTIFLILWSRQGQRQSLSRFSGAHDRCPATGGGELSPIPAMDLGLHFLACSKSIRASSTMLCSGYSGYYSPLQPAIQWGPPRLDEPLGATNLSAQLPSSTNACIGWESLEPRSDSPVFASFPHQWTCLPHPGWSLMLPALTSHHPYLLKLPRLPLGGFTSLVFLASSHQRLQLFFPLNCAQNGITF